MRILVLVPILSLVACGRPPVTPPPPPPNTPNTPHDPYGPFDAGVPVGDCVEGAFRCAADSVQKCVRYEGIPPTLAWNSDKVCGDGEVCANGACMPGCHGGCPSGYRCEATSCVAQELTVTDLVIDVPVVTAVLAINVDGGVPAENCSTAAIGHLSQLLSDGRRTNGSQVLQFGCDGGTATVEAIPGSYGLSVYGLKLPDGGLAWPALSNDAVRRTVTIGPSGGRVDVDLNPALGLVSFTGALTVNGATPSVSGGCATNGIGGVAARVFLVPTSGSEMALEIPCSTTTFTFAGTAPAGAYDVWVALPDNTPLSPVFSFGGPTSSRDWPTGQRVTIPDSSTPVTLNVDLSRTAVSGRVRHNGAAPSSIGDCTNVASRLKFGWMNAAGSRFAQVAIPCSSTTFDFNLLLPAGDWMPLISTGLRTSTGAPVTDLPKATWTGPTRTFTPGVSAIGDLDVESVQFSGHLLVDGAAPSRTSTTCASPTEPLVDLHLSSGEWTGVDIAIPCNTQTFAFGPVTVPRATYRLDVRAVGAGTNVPDDLRIESFPLLSSGDYPIEVHPPGLTTEVTGTLQVNGLPPVIREGCDGNSASLHFTRGQPGQPDYANESTVVSCGTPATWSAPLKPGSWSVLVTPASADFGRRQSLIAGWPSVSNAYSLPPIQVSAAGSAPFALNVPIRWVSAKLRVNGVDAAPVAACFAAPTPNLPVRVQELTFGQQFSGSAAIRSPCAAPADLQGPVFSGRYLITSGLAVIQVTNVPMAGVLAEDVLIP